MSRLQDQEAEAEMIPNFPFTKANLPSRDPFGVFREWSKFAGECGMVISSSAMALATASKDGAPSVRHVMLDGDPITGFKFFTHSNSLKGKQLEENPLASAVFLFPHQSPFFRQVRITGNVTKLSDEECDLKWETYGDPGKVIHYMNQGQRIQSVEELNQMRVQILKDHSGTPQQRPPTSCRYIITPYEVEFYQGAYNMLNDRIIFKKLSAGETFDPVTMEKGDDGWTIYRIVP